MYFFKTQLMISPTSLNICDAVEISPNFETKIISQSWTTPSSIFSTASPSSLERVPTEIWQQIFSILVVSEQRIVFEEMISPIWGRKCPSSTSSPYCLLPRTPTILSSVCFYWRQVALGMPEIWSMLCLKAPHAEPDNVGAQRPSKMGDLIKSWLLHSTPLPLKLLVIAKDNVAGAETILRSLIPACARWEALHIHAPFKALSILAQLQAGDVPLLASVNIHHRGNHGQDTSLSPSPFHLCNISDSLRRFCTSSLPTSPFNSTFCSYLQEVHIQEIPSETWPTLRFLRACGQLRVLTLSGYGVTTILPDTFHNSTVTLPELETLNLEHPSGRNELIRMLTLPKLKSLWLGGLCNASDPVLLLNELKSLLKRSELASLDSLSLVLETHGLDYLALVDFLKATPTLHTLRIDDSCTFMHRPLVTSELLAALTIPDLRQVGIQTDKIRLICPQLKFISFINCSAVDDHILLQFLRSRSESHCSIPNLPHRGEERHDSYEISILESVDISFKKKIQNKALEAWKKEIFV